MEKRINNQGQAKIFDNPILESLSKTRPWVIYAIYLPLCSYSLYYSYSSLGYSAGFIAVLFFVGIFSWTFFEYIAHRFLFHYEATSPLGKRIVYIFHGTHHEYPRDKERLFMPPVPSVVFALIVFCIIYVLFLLFSGSGNHAFIFFPGFITGYLMYVSVHYAIHRYPPPKRFKALWRNHHLHHYKYPDHGFGVSSTLWDHIFGTVPRKDLQKDSARGSDHSRSNFA
jgi:sterol desaturase/sphingolipid hydroxylase (fatty acid hydroxylase superfamily)